MGIVNELNDLGLRTMVQAIVRRYLDQTYEAPPQIKRDKTTYCEELNYSDNSDSLEWGKTKTKTLFMDTGFLNMIDEFCRDVRRLAAMQAEDYLDRLRQQDEPEVEVWVPDLDEEEEPSH